jgi:hypothetical protein
MARAALLLAAFGVDAACAAAPAVFGTQQRPAACPADRTVPAQGPLSADQARAYFHCTNEHETSLAGLASILFLVDGLEIRLAQKARAPTASDVLAYRTSRKGHIEISREHPVYDIKASFRETTCHSLPRYEPGASCSAVFFPMSSGLCFRDTMGDWYCRLHPDSWRAQQPAAVTLR